MPRLRQTRRETVESTGWQSSLRNLHLWEMFNAIRAMVVFARHEGFQHLPATADNRAIDPRIHNLERINAYAFTNGHAETQCGVEIA